jgi:PAS domain S-box-containing protein
VLVFNSLVKKLEQTTEKLSRRELELSTIKELMEIANGDLMSIDDLMNLLLGKSMTVTGVQIGSVFMVEPETRNKYLVLSKPSAMSELALYRFRVIAAMGHTKELKKGLYIDIDTSIAKTVLMERRPVLIQDIEKDPRTLKTNDPQYGPPSFLSMPIFIGNDLSAVLNLANKKMGLSFDANDQQILTIMFRNVSFTLESAMLQSRIKEQLEKIKGHNIELEKEIERRKRTEIALIESEQQYRLLVENSRDIIYTIDVTGHFTYVNPVAERITGYPASDLIGKHYLSLVQPGYHEEIAALYKKQYREKIPSSYYEFPLITLDGSTKWLGQNVQLLLKDEIIIGFQAVARDITERKLSEKTLKESEDRFRQLADAAFEGIIIHDNGVILDVNQSLLQMCLYDYHEVIGKNIANFILPESKDIILQKIASGYDKCFEVLVKKKDGTTLTFEVNGKSIIYRGKPARVVALRDITESKQA